jgi:hypothetical protein
MPRRHDSPFGRPCKQRGAVTEGGVGLDATRDRRGLRSRDRGRTGPVQLSDKASDPQVLRGDVEAARVRGSTYSRPAFLRNPPSRADIGSVRQESGRVAHLGPFGRRNVGTAAERRTLPSVDVETRAIVRRSVSDARRRLADAELDETGVAGMQTSGSRNKSLPLVAWEACDGDGLLALAYVLDVLKAKQEGQLDAA